jgi:hypothetical protein
MLLLLFAASATDPVTPPVPPPAPNELGGGGGGGASSTSRSKGKALWQDDSTGPQPFVAMMRNIAIALIASGALEEFD